MYVARGWRYHTVRLLSTNMEICKFAYSRLIYDHTGSFGQNIDQVMAKANWAATSWHQLLFFKIFETFQLKLIHILWECEAEIRTAIILIHKTPRTLEKAMRIYIKLYVNTHTKWLPVLRIDVCLGLWAQGPSTIVLSGCILTSVQSSPLQSSCRLGSSSLTETDFAVLGGLLIKPQINLFYFFKGTGVNLCLTEIKTYILKHGSPDRSAIPIVT